MCKWTANNGSTQTSNFVTTIKESKEEGGKISEGIDLSLDLNSTKLNRVISMLFIATDIFLSLL